MYEITYLDASREPVTHVAGAGEVGDVVAWAGSHGVKIRVRPYTRPKGEPASGSAGKGDEQR
ncbi:hypothetical protein [Streptomyces sp. NPDC097981]|uniref:hypothetical protein n=1 Tax=Streptomyces sp. NPDC097981 TaxID=3155428 RepID=UPI003332FCDA